MLKRSGIKPFAYSMHICRIITRRPFHPPQTQRYNNNIHSSSSSQRPTSFIRDLSFVSAVAGTTFLTCATIQIQTSYDSFKQNTTSLTNTSRFPSWQTIRSWISSNPIFTSYQLQKEADKKFLHRIDQINRLPIPSIFRRALSNCCRTYYLMTQAQRLCLGIVSINFGVFLMWKFMPARRMIRWFTDETFSRRSATLLTGAWSHADLWHLGMNMYAMYSFGPLCAYLLGLNHFMAFYVTAGMVSMLGSRYGRRMLGQRSFALGASGALFGCLGLVAETMPDRRVSLIFLPDLSFSISTGVFGMMLFDLVCLLRGYQFFDHFGHLAGALFGLTYGYLHTRSSDGDDLWSKFLQFSYEIMKRIKG